MQLCVVNTIIIVPLNRISISHHADLLQYAIIEIFSDNLFLYVQ
jgi:hypothetical protein